MQTLHDFFHHHHNSLATSVGQSIDFAWILNSENFRALENKLNCQFNDKKLLLEALIHPSLGNENKSFSNLNYQRLEFLGDSVLGLILANELYRRFPLQKEGELSKMKAYLAGQAMVSRLGEAFNLEDFLIFSKGTRENILKGNSSPSQPSFKFMCDAVEALLAAVYLDKGIEAATQLFQVFTDKYEAIFTHNFFDESAFLDFDPKTRLQEKAMELFKELPVYLCREQGPFFECELKIRGQFFALGQGGNKKEAEKAAARVALLNINLKS